MIKRPAGKGFVQWRLSACAALAQIERSAMLMPCALLFLRNTGQTCAVSFAVPLDGETENVAL